MSPYYPSDVDYYEYIQSPEWRPKADAAKRRVGYRRAINAEYSEADGYRQWRVRMHYQLKTSRSLSGPVELT